MSLSGSSGARARSGNWRGLRHRVTPDRLPDRVNLKPPRWATMIFAVFGAVWTAFSLPLVAQIGSGPSAALIFAALFPVIGLGMIAWSLYTLLSKREALFGRDGVEVVGRTPVAREKWWQPYSSYKGVLHREHVVNRKNGSTTYQIVELLHDEPGKTLPLLVEASRKMPREAWERYAKWLDLPALEETAGGVITRDHGDLDKSVRELAAEGKIAPRLEAAAGPPPKGLQVVKDRLDGEDCLRVTLTAGRMPLWFIALFCSVPAVVLVVGLMDSLGLAAFALLFIAGAVATFVYDRRATREITVTRTRLSVTDPWQKRAAEKMSFDLNEIESIAIRRARSNIGKDIVIASDRTQVQIGSGLSQEALGWLQNYLTAAITTA